MNYKPENIVRLGESSRTNVKFFLDDVNLNFYPKSWYLPDKPEGFRCVEVSYEMAKNIVNLEGFQPVFPSELRPNEYRILGLYNGITFFQGTGMKHTMYYSGNYGCEGSRVS